MTDSIGPITTDLIGKLVWSEELGWVTVRAMWCQSVHGVIFLVEDKEGQLLESNYGQLSTKEPDDVKDDVKHECSECDRLSMLLGDALLHTPRSYHEPIYAVLKAKLKTTDDECPGPGQE